MATLTATNSYATRDQASAIFDGRPGASAWASANDAKRDAALMEATAELQQRVTWRGRKPQKTRPFRSHDPGLSEMEYRSRPTPSPRSLCERYRCTPTLFSPAANLRRCARPGQRQGNANPTSGLIARRRADDHSL